MSNFSIILAISTSAIKKYAFFKFLDSIASFKQKIEIIVVDNGVIDRAEETRLTSQRRLGYMLQYIHLPASGIDDALKTGISKATTEWIVLLDHISTISSRTFEECEKFFKKKPQVSLVLVCSTSNNKSDTSSSEHKPQELTSDNGYIGVDQLNFELQKTNISFFRRELLIEFDFEFLSHVRDGFRIISITAYYLLVYRDIRISILNISYRYLKKMVSWQKPEQNVWKNVKTYNEVLNYSYLFLLRKACIEDLKAPLWLQKTVLMELLFYFAKDMEERSPTVIVSEPKAEIFHDLVSGIMRYIDVNTIELLAVRTVHFETKHALLSYKGKICNSPVYIDTYDHYQELIRLRYYCHGIKPLESFFLDGHKVEPAYSKYRACRFFRRLLFHERIVWLSADLAAKELTVELSGKDVPTTTIKKKLLSIPGSSSQDSSIRLNTIRTMERSGKAKREGLPSGLPGLKVRLVRWLARSVSIKNIFKDAWVLSDRENEADDNAEHMYRWIRKYHPEINAWFLLSRFSTDWDRLKKDGFRLLSIIWLRKLLILNCRYYISSQLDSTSGGLRPDFYGDLMRFSFIYLKHGVTINDQSHWYNNNEIDLVVATTPAEYSAFVEDDTPYFFTGKNAALVGMPRFDALLTMAKNTKPEEVDSILIMPTWRGSLIDDRAHTKISSKGNTVFCGSDYLKSWRALLSSEKLQSVATNNGLRLVFMPHPSALPYLDAFEVPPYVDVLTKKDIGILPVFCRTAVMITDYSSVAFEMGFLHRPVIYYQFDREQFYGGSHNWREGYFDYSRDGFGPVAKNQNQVISHLERILKNNAQPSCEFLERMEKTFPLCDNQACKRLYERIVSMQKPFVKSQYKNES